MCRTKWCPLRPRIAPQVKPRNAVSQVVCNKYLRPEKAVFLAAMQEIYSWNDSTPATVQLPKIPFSRPDGERHKCAKKSKPTRRLLAASSLICPAMSFGFSSPNGIYWENGFALTARLSK